jgi:Lrp/AsnC family leucine-responsive transcriptional regulator
MKMDDINWKILTELQQNGRMTIRELSSKIGLSGPSVSDRIQKMEQKGIIKGYRAEINYKNLGYDLGIYISIKLRFGMNEKFEKFIQNVPEIHECHKLTGQECMLMRGYVRDTNHLEKLNTSLSHYGELTTSLLLSSVVSNKIVMEAY